MSTTYTYSPSDLVLVTGGNGHVAQHVVDQLLALPQHLRPRVRASVRSDATAKGIADFYKSKGIESGLELVVVPDIVKKGAFDEAVKGATFIAHIASPLTINVQSTEHDLLIPAREGTLGILRSAVAEPSIKSVVITSSFGAVFDAKQGWRPGYTYTAADYNPLTWAEAADPALDLTAWPETWRPYITYIASKVLAERAAADFHADHKPGFALTFVLPVYIGGPSVLPPSLTRPSFSQQLIRQTATGPTLPQMDWPGWLDVRDVAKAHIEALRRAPGGRWIVSAGPSTYSNLANIVRRNFPQLKPSEEVQNVDHYAVDATPALTGLGLGQYIPHEKMVVDTVQQMLDEKSS